MSIAALGFHSLYPWRPMKAIKCWKCVFVCVCEMISNPRLWLMAIKSVVNAVIYYQTIDGLRLKIIVRPSVCPSLGHFVAGIYLQVTAFIFSLNSFLINMTDIELRCGCRGCYRQCCVVDAVLGVEQLNCCENLQNWWMRLKPLNSLELFSQILDLKAGEVIKILCISWQFC